MLSHEDDGMMGQFIVTDNTTKTNEQLQDRIEIYPNPIRDKAAITGLNPSTIELYNTAGQILSRIVSNGGEEQIDLEQKESGVYFIRVIEGNEKHSFKILKL